VHGSPIDCTLPADYITIALINTNRTTLYAAIQHTRGKVCRLHADVSHFIYVKFPEQHNGELITTANDFCRNLTFQALHGFCDKLTQVSHFTRRAVSEL